MTEDPDRERAGRRAGTIAAIVGLVLIAAFVYFFFGFEIDFDAWESNF